MTQTPASGAARSGHPKRAAPQRRIWPRVLIVAASFLLAALGVATVIYALSIDHTITSNVNRGVDLPSDTPTGAGPGEVPRPTKGAQERDTLNYVLLGSDSRDPNGGNGRSDSIVMVIHLNAKRNRAYIISFPRDMYVTIPGHGRNKLDAAYALGGPPLSVRTLETLTAVRMDHVVLADFDGFIQLTDDLNGVTVTNKTAFSSHGYNFPEGEITLRGEQALWFVRESTSLPRGDLDRTENQRNVIKAIVSKGLSAKVVADPATFTHFIGNLTQHLVVDNSLTDSEIRQTVLSTRLKGDKVEGLQAPLAGFGTTADGQRIDIVDTARLDELCKALRTDDMADYLNKYPQG